MRKLQLLSVAFLLLFAASIVWAAGSQEGATTESGREIVTVDWFVNEGWFNRPWDMERPVDQLITEKSGAKINFMSSAGGGTGTEKLNAMIAADDLTDVVTMGWWYSQFQELQAANMVHKLNEIIPEYSPELWANTPEFMRNWYTFEDGNWYGYANMFWAPEDFTDRNYMKSNVGMVARKDIMDELGITAEDFNTQDSMIEALKKVRDANIQYNGLDVVPLYFTPNGGFPGTYTWHSMFAVPREDADGDLIDQRLHPKFLEEMLFANRLFEEGLISKENWTADRNQIDEKIVSGSIFALMCNVADYQAQWANLYRADPAAEYVGVGPVRAQDGAEPQFVSTGLTGWLVSMISDNTDYLEEIMALWTFLRSEEGHRLQAYGVEGESYVMDDNGRVQWTDQYIEYLQDPDVDPATDIYGNTNLWLLQDSVYMQQIEPPPATPAQAVGVNVWEYFAKYTYNETAFNNLGPFGGTDESAIAAEISTYWEAQIPKMVLAEGGADEVRAIYDESVAHIERLGIDAVLEVQNRRFQENKAKLGWEHAWPPLRN
jgi:putative aldouronate transport system substrate-binding protein